MSKEQKVQLFGIRCTSPTNKEYYGFYDTHRLVVYLYEDLATLKLAATRFRTEPMYRWDLRYVLAEDVMRETKVELLA